MDENLFKKRTKQLALRVIKVVDALPRNRTADVLGSFCRETHDFFVSSFMASKKMLSYQGRRIVTPGIIG
ncbi:MAG: hypothetical protein ACREOI_36055, partial [bacterium]